ncbi:hypothetical protein ASE06_16385 [Sphingopyxis sp. Root214]|uniref:autotransporter-associated beta strand repeat-containing protein n=1 Tax=Sphingopyxis sp. Root154 TaxID=1736476 RepID=UPI0006FD6DC6|nr:autotransporter-associated beta strand repeat-containing protein [Sphingopyxis sp. Root154]KQZ73892.1 hypothetical protein ASD73_14040 [Sphingopyxis sp. Root154]KRC08032.1 hypothetical protein ASE06_16385 [Sphingopyxis sp. Root214]
MFSLPSPANAQQDRYWDPNGTAANRGGTGTWDTASSTWSPNGDGVSGPYTPWNNGGVDNAIFGGPNGTNATVTLITPIRVGNLTFDANTTYSLTSSTLTLAGTAPTITTNGTATINSILAGNAGLTKAGSGALTLTGANVFSGGVNVTQGILTVNGDAALGVDNNITLSAGASLRSTGALASTRVVTLAGAASIGGGVGSARITGAGSLQLVQSTTLNNDANDFTGDINANGVNLSFTSVGNIGQASSLGAGNTIFIGSEIGAGSTSAVYTGDGDVSNRGWSMRNGGGGISLINQGTGTLSLTGNFSQSGLTTVFVAFSAQTADMELLGDISGFRPIFFQGSGTARTITLGGTNSFTAPTAIQGVTVKASSLANRGTVSSLGTGMTGDGTIAFTSGALSYTGTGGGTNRALLLNGVNSVLNDGTGALALSGAVAFNAAAPADALILGGGFAGTNTLSGVISGTGNLVMSGGAGNVWLLSGANIFVGSTTVNSGTLQLGSDQALGAPNALVVNGGTLDLNTHDLQATSLAGTGGSVALNGADLTVNGAASTSYSGGITGNGSLVKHGTGTLALSGQSTYTGDTTINGGTLALNFTAAGAPASDIISAQSALNMAGGTLALTGAAGGVNSQTFDGLNVTAGNNRIVATSGAGGSMVLNLGTLTRTGGLLDFTLPVSGAITTSNGDGALGWATVNGTDYAQVLGGTIAAFTAYANKDDAGTWLTGDVVSDAGGAANTAFFNTLTSDVQLAGLKYTAATNSTVTVGGANTLGVDGTIIVASSVGNTSQTITGGSLTGSAGGGTVGVLHNGTGTGAFTIAATIVDNGGATGFIKGGSGKVSLTGTNSYTGGTTLSGGTLAISSVANAGAASSIGASTADSANLVIESGTLEYAGAGAGTTDRGFTLVNGGPSRTIQVTNGGANLTFGGVVVGPDDAGLTKTGAGTLTLANAANSYGGATTVSAGTLSVNTLANGGAASGIGASTADSANLVLQNAGGLQFTGATTSTNRGFTLGTGNGRIDVSDPAAVLTVSGVATGVGGLVKEGTGTLELTGTNLYQGGTAINAGTVRAGSVQAFGNQNALMGVATGATLDLAGFANKVGALAGGGNVVLGSATLTTGGANGTFTGTISGSGGFTRAAGGTQTMLGCSNSYTGVTSVVGGALSVDCLANGGLASGIGASSNASGNLVLNNSSLIYTGGSTSIDRGLTAIVTGAINVANAATVLGIGGVVTGSGAFRKDGAGTLILSGNNNYTGVTTVTGGILRAGSNTAIGRGGFGLNNTAGVVLDLDNFNTSIAFLNGGGAAGGHITLGTATLTIAGNAGAGNYAGAISGSGGLVKGGTFTQTLSGCASSFTGSTVINGGLLQVGCLADGGTNSAIGAASNAAGNLVLNGGTLSYVGAAGSTDRLFTLGGSAGSRLEASGSGAIAFTNTGAIAFSAPGTNQTIALGGTNSGNNSLAAQITDNGAGVTSLTKDGLGTWILNNPNSNYTGITTINGGVLGVDKLSNGGLASSIGASSAAAANLVIGNGSTLRYTGTGDTTNRLFTLSAGTTFLESSGTGAIVFTDTGLVTLAGADQARTIALGGTNTGNNTLAGSIGNAGTGVTVLAKNDAGTWVLTGTNTYTGLTNINAGTLILGNGGTAGSIASATVNNLGVLGFNRADTLTYGGVIAQSGSVRQLGAGITILTGANTYTGGTTISAGTLQLGNGGTTGSITGNVTNDGVLDFNRSNIATFDGVISGSGSVKQSGAGTTILTGSNSYTGGTAINAGTLQISSDANLGAAAGPLSFNNGILRTTANITSARAATLAGAGTMLTDAGTSFTLGGVVSGAGGLTKSGTGTLILTGTNGYAGGTTISGGTLSLGNGGTTGSILGNVTNNGSLVFDRSDNNGFGGFVSGTGSLTQRGSGIVTLTANNSYTGATNVTAGTLLINGNQSGATGLTSVAAGAALGGSGIIGGNVNVANGGILAPGNSPGTLTINGDLSLASGSILNFEFGQADVAGGPLNDLVNVGGNLVLDGTINVSESAGGTFGGGIYRMFNYGGALTDNGLTLGVLPVGSSVTVQTSVAGQVNLINSLGLSLSFWDGTAGPKFNNVINGGNGTWYLGGVDNNWTNADGSVNAAYADNTLAIFAGTAGTVTLDNTGGAVTASGLQFASNGYLINGAPLTLSGPESMIRVGDGTAAGAGFTATIATALTGATKLVKTDLGTLVLTGANSYSGGTAINGGTLRIASDANLGAGAGGLDFNGGTLNTTANITTSRAVTLTGAGSVLTNAGTVLTLAGSVAGGGRLTKSGAGTLLLTGDAMHSGGTTIAAGALQIGDGGTTGSIAGDIVVNAGTGVSFNRSDSSSYGGSITGAGVIFVDEGQLTLTGNSSVGGTINVQQNATLIINAGNTVSTGAVATVGGGTISVSGSGSAFAAQRLNALTSTGATTVNVTNGGTIRTTAGPVSLAPTGAAGPATLNVSGTGSLVDIAGALTAANGALAGTTATVTISGGGTVRSSGLNVIGSLNGNTTPSTVTITGAGSNWTSTGVLLQRNGQFSVLAGGAARFDSAQIGTIAAQGASALVSGAGSTFTTTGELVVGSTAGSGVLTIADGARVTAGSLTIADDAVGVTGVVNIGGVEGGPAAAAGFLDGAITFGPGTGRLNFNHIETDYLFANAMSGAGVVNHAAGTTRLTGDSSGFTGTTSVAGGTLLVDGILGGAASLVSVATGGTLGGTGTIGGNVEIFDGNLNPGDVGGIPGRLTIAGNLSLAPAATLNVDFGEANVVGGALNDLIDVGGDLTLDGTLNVAVPPGGSFDPGVYRIINYGGTLSDNGLTVNSGYFVQTSVANQVNLVNTTGLTMRFWDGVNGAKNDGAITGGDGLWQASGGNDNWTEFDGSANAPFTDDAFAVFSGVGGTVTVDGSLGAVTASGMQFASDGYIVAGDDITLVGPEAIIRVGDGTVGGAGYTATIASNLTGVGDVIKSDLGTLVLTGTNSFAGETYVKAGELRLADGGALSNTEGRIGRESGEQAVVTVIGTDGSGNASTWTNTAGLRIGDKGAGTLNILDGGAVSVADIAYIGYDFGSRGTVTVSGADGSGNASTWTGANDIVIGEFGTGTLNITAGGQVSNQSGWIGSNAGSQGIVNVSGIGANGVASAWTNNADVLVGYNGNGTLNIADGGKVVSVGGQIGVDSDGIGRVLVTGAGSSWENSGRINVGLFGAGTLRIENGATVTSNDGVVGASARGDAVISGAGTSWVNTEQLNIGSFGTGTLRIENGASVISNQGYIGANDAGSVVVTGAGSNWLVTDFGMTVGNDGDGSLTIEDGGRVRAEGGVSLGVADGVTSTVTLLGTPGNRGALETGEIGAGLGTVNFSLDGGVLRATAGNDSFFADFDTHDITLGVNGGVIDTDVHDIGISPRFVGAGGLTKDGAGTLTLSGASSYAGATLVNAGTLLVNGDQSAATGLMTVFSGAALGGNGTIGGNVDLLDGGILAPGTSAGTLTINGNLSLAGGSILNYEFGQADVAGGALNDLVNVGGDLTLDGTINVTVPTGGSFGPGIYRVLNYGGALVDNGLTLGAIPGGTAGVSVQTAIAGQVNLVNAQGLALSFWDGAVGPKNNSAVNGGDGVWQVAGGSNNWTDANGTVNADYVQDSFAIFSAAPGTVTVDNSGGNVLASGMQFASNGYVIAGDRLTLTGASAIVQVGDSSAAGAGYIATIGAELAGSARLVKTDLGTLVLTNTNSYTGGTAINGGTLRISGDANLGAVTSGLGLNGGTLHTTASFASARQFDLTGAGSFLTDAGTTLTLTGSLGGVGGLTKTGAGTLVLGGTGSHRGGTTVGAGTLFVNGDYAGVTGRTSVASGATLGGTGTIGGDMTLADGATLAPGAGGVGTLTIGGNLSLASGTRLAFELGEAGVAGGALNDLVNVGGNLTLDGTIDVAAPAGGAFDVGVYRLFNYGGALTDNGLSLGTLPAGANVGIQTSIAGQVNLVNSAGLTLNFWDGAAGPKNNSIINGGNGIWQASRGNDHWTNASGAVNAAYSDGAFAVFGGTAGTVTVDNALGAVLVAGMQFAADGYVIAGGGITLDAPQTVIRVGDGSSGAAGFKATINSVLAGAAELVKTDAGTLVLGGANSYTGGTRISGGTVQIASDANLGAAAGKVTLDGGTLATSADLVSNREIAVAGPGTIATAANTTFTYGGLFTGPGTLTKAGSGTLRVTGNSDGFGGSTTVAAGTLAVQGRLGGAVTVASGARLEGGGQIGSLVNAGVVAPGNSIGTLTIAGDYEGRGGVLEIEAELGGDTSVSDRLVVGGATAGSTTVRVTNRGGLGAPTVEGIKIVDVAGASNGSFALDGDYLFEGQQAVVVGAYGYRLYKNGVATPQDGDWYLRSALLSPIDPEVPLYQPGVPVYEAYVGALQALNGLPTLQQRVGNRSWAGTSGADGTGIWGRFESQRLRPEAAFSTSGADRKADGWQAQMGADAMLAQRSDGATLVGGINAHYGTADTAVASIFGNGSIDTKGYGVGASLTWYGPQGFYVDGQAKLSWFDSDLESNILGALVEGNKGKGRAFSVELGKRSSIGSNLTVTPQIQMTYAHVGFDRFIDPVEAVVSPDRGDSLKTRWGLSLDHQQSWGATGEGRRTHVYATINLAYEWLDGARVDVSDTPIENRGQRLTGELGFGGSYSWGGGRFTLYTEVTGDTGLADFGAGYSLKGTAGLRMRF